MLSEQEEYVPAYAQAAFAQYVPRLRFDGVGALQATIFVRASGYGGGYSSQSGSESSAIGGTEHVSVSSDISSSIPPIEVHTRWGRLRPSPETALRFLPGRGSDTMVVPSQARMVSITSAN